jgi:hypothetical protein
MVCVPHCYRGWIVEKLRVVSLFSGSGNGKLSAERQNSSVNTFLFVHNHHHGKATIGEDEYRLIKADLIFQIFEVRITIDGSIK